MRDIGADNVTIEALPDNEGPWLAGRAARVLIGGEWVGCFGEIDPAISQTFELLVPLNGAEFDVEALKSVIQILCDERHVWPIRISRRPMARVDSRY